MFLKFLFGVFYNVYIDGVLAHFKAYSLEDHDMFALRYLFSSIHGSAHTWTMDGPVEPY